LQLFYRKLLRFFQQVALRIIIKVFVDADSDERLIRVINRDIKERGRTAEMVMDRYCKVLKPMHLQFIEPSKRYADLIIPEGGRNRIAINILSMFIKKSIEHKIDD
jgi:uridine kinase